MYLQKVALYIWALLVSATLSCVFLSPLQAQTANRDYADGGLYIKLRNHAAFAVKSGENRQLTSARFSFLQNLQKDFGVHSQVSSLAFENNPILSQTISVTIDSVQKIDEFIEELLQNPEIEYVEKIPLYYTCGFSGDPSLSQPKEEHKYNDPLYGILNGVNHGWTLDVINAEGAWALAQAKPSVKVAVVDNAVWGKHEDLQIDSLNLYNVLYKTVGNANPPVSFSQDPQCTSLNNCESYLWSHGTHCAGNVGAINNNGKGMASIGGGVSLMGISCPSSISGAVENSFEGLRYAAENGAKVISMSWGSYSAPGKTETALIKTCYEKGIIMLAAAGNNQTSNRFYPACMPYVISIGSVNSDKKHSEEFSNFGPWVDLSAPGGFVVSTLGTSTSYSVLSTTWCTNQNYRLNGYNSLSGQFYDGFFGTSMATPIAAGLCGLLLSVDSTLSPHRMRELLISTCQEIKGGNKNYVREGSGIINAEAAVKAIKDKVPMPYNCTFSLNVQDLVFSWNAPKTEGTDLALSHYRIYKNGKMVKDNHKEVSYSETNLEAGNYSYSVEAVYTNQKISLRDGVDFIVPVYYSLDIALSPSPQAGTVTGSGKFEGGTEVTVTAKASPGYAFLRWKEVDQQLSTDSTYSFKIKYNTSLSAVFRRDLSNQTWEKTEELSFYPNPATHRIVLLNLPQGTYEIRIFDMQGKCQQSSSSLGKASTSLSVSDLSKGPYLIVAKELNGKRVLTAKFNKL